MARLLLKFPHGTAPVPATALGEDSAPLTVAPRRTAVTDVSSPTRLRSTIELVARSKAGDAQAWDDLCLHTLQVLSRFAAGRLPGMARGMVETQDVVQEAAMRGLRRLDRFEFRHDGAFRAYLRTVLMNVIRDQARAAARAPIADSLSDDHPERGPSPFELAIGRQRTAHYELALQKLSSRDRQAIILRLEQQASYEEMAGALNLPTPNAARQRVRRALLRLGREMTRLQRRPDVAFSRSQP
jgi:RNA polymerase sigma factor (sigma-70 family)